MRFESPVWLALLAIIPLLALVFAAGERRGAYHLRRFAAPRLLPILGRSAGWPRVLRACLMMAAFGLLAVALARPSYGYRLREIHAKGADILFAVDVSRSMLCTDVAPNRLTRAKMAAKDMLAVARGHRIGVIPFSREAFLQCPLTLDKTAVMQSLDAVGTTNIPKQGTSLADPIAEARKAFASSGENKRILVIFTDGEDLEGNGLAEAREAKDMIIVTVGTGTVQGAPVPVSETEGSGYIKDASGSFVTSRLDSGALESVAAATNGLYGHVSSPALPAQFKELMNRDEQEANTEAANIRIPVIRYRWPLAAALVLLIAEAFIPAFRRKGGAVLLFLLLFLPAAPDNASAAGAETTPSAQPAPTQEAGANAIPPVNPRRDYNKGVEFFNAGNYPAAVEAFAKAADHCATSPDELKKQIHGNAGAAKIAEAISLLPPDDAPLPEQADKAARELLKSAKTDIEKALSLAPEDALLRDNFRLIDDALAEIDRRKQTPAEEKKKKQPPQPDEEKKKDDPLPTPEHKEEPPPPKDKEKGNNDNCDKNQGDSGQNKDSSKSGDGQSDQSQGGSGSSGGQQGQSDQNQQGSSGQNQQQQQQNPQPQQGGGQDQQQPSQGQSGQNQQPQDDSGEKEQPRKDQGQQPQNEKQTQDGDKNRNQKEQPDQGEKPQPQNGTDQQQGSSGQNQQSGKGEQAQKQSGDQQQSPNKEPRESSGKDQSSPKENAQQPQQGPKEEPQAQPKPQAGDKDQGPEQQPSQNEQPQQQNQDGKQQGNEPQSSEAENGEDRQPKNGADRNQPQAGDEGQAPKALPEGRDAGAKETASSASGKDAPKPKPEAGAGSEEGPNGGKENSPQPSAGNQAGEQKAPAPQPQQGAGAGTEPEAAATKSGAKEQAPARGTQETAAAKAQAAAGSPEPQREGDHTAALARPGEEKAPGDKTAPAQTAVASPAPEGQEGPAVKATGAMTPVEAEQLLKILQDDEKLLPAGQLRNQRKDNTSGRDW